MGKLLGLTFGYLVGGILGGVLGLWLGHAFDAGLQGHLTSPLDRQEAHHRFFDLTFQVMGHLAKADGRVNEQEIAQARNIMNQMRLSESQRFRAMGQFNAGKEPEYDLQAALEQFNAIFNGNWPLKQLFLEVQIQAACADGTIQAREKALLGSIASALRFSPGRLEEIARRFQAEQAFYRTHYRDHEEGSRQYGSDHLGQAYAVLGISPQASDGEVKKAYRKQMSQHHPDKLAAKGLPPDMMRMATEKAQAIQQAYAHICQVRQQQSL